jgi:rifampicin phosphotransferase
MRALGGDDPRAELERRGGGKALNLHLLTAQGQPVPAWAVVGIDALERFVEGAGLQDEIEQLVAADSAEARRRVRDLLLEPPLQTEVAEVIAEAYERAGGEEVAVRSSAVEEDAAGYSFAGQFDSFLNVRGLDQVIARVRCCWASAYGERAALYRREQGLSARPAPMAVVVQRLVRAERSGVLFTVNPINGSSHEMVISSVFGLGQSLVEGSVDADTVVIDRASGKTRHTYVGEKSAKTVPAADAEGCVEVDIPAEQQSCLSLTNGQIAVLARAGGEIEDAFGSPRDVEWAFADGALWILQSRPVTATAAAPGGVPGAEEPRGQMRIWDNSNIIESFGGVTSPLTFTFARHLYHQVFRWYCRSLRVPERLVREMDEWQANRLAYFNGRVYYNLLNWYRMQRLLPFVGMKRRMMEVAMGVDEALSEEIAAEVRPLPHRSPARERRLRLVVSAVFAWRFFRSSHDVRRFVERFEETFTRLDAIDYESMSAEELYEQILTLDRELLPTWGPMVALEAVILTALGLLFGLTQRWLPDAPRWFYWNVGKPAAGVESAAPARAMLELVEIVLADPGLERSVREAEPEDAYARLVAEGRREFLAAVDAYVARYGYRSVDELKLEEPSMRDDIAVFFTLLRGSLAGGAARSGDTAAPGGDTAEIHDPDVYLGANMGRVRRSLYEVLRRKAQATLAGRERIRFCRSQGFGLARRMAKALDRELLRIGVTAAEGDVFQLRLEELRGAFEGSISHEELGPLIALRKRQQAVHERLTPPSRFVTRGPMYWYGNLERAGWYEGPASDGRGTGEVELEGIGCCPGVVVGEAKVVDVPVDVDGGVLVAYRTDPGWIAALSSASALLVERGSPLTHVAIVARELGLPTVVQIKGLTASVRTGEVLSVDGGAGTVSVLSRSS